MQGSINHSGGLTFTHAGKTVTATNFVLNTTQRTLSATVNGKQVPLLAVDLFKMVRTTRDRLIVASGITSTLVPTSPATRPSSSFALGKSLVTCAGSSEQSEVGITAAPAPGSPGRRGRVRRWGGSGG